MKTVRVLMVEDSPTDAKLILRALGMPSSLIRSERVENAVAMREALATSAWDLILSDNSLPGFDAASALRIIKDLGLDLPFIIVSGTIDEESAVAVMRAGAHDYVLKGNLARLAPAVERELREAAERAERRRADAANAMLAARFHAMIENSVNPVMLIALDGTIIYASPTSDRIYGRPVSELVGRRASELILEADREKTRKALGVVMTDPSHSASALFRVARPDGSLCWVEGTVSNMLGEPSVAAIVANVRDVTERQQANEKLAVSEARYRRIVETTNEGVWQIDAENRTTYMNARMARMLGYTVEEAMALSVESLLHPADARPPQVSLAQRVGAGTSREVRFRHRDGSTVWTRVETLPLHDEHGRFEGAFGMVLDISEQRAADHGRIVAEEALRKSETQLRQAQKMEAVGRLAGGVAHDFNNLLSVILSYSTMLLEDFAPDNPIRGDIFEICQAGRRAAELTRQLLAFSHQQVLEPQLIDVNVVVANMERMCRRILGEDVELVSLPGPRLGKVKVDPGSLEQVIMNLVVNARDAMPAGGRIVIETQSVDLDEDFADAHLGVTAGPHVMLVISDNGHGMEREVRDRIFEPFFTTKEKGKGTGLGLSTVFGIVQQSEGTIWVYSEAGKGTTFKIYLPQAQTGTTIRRARSGAAIASLRGSETVLLVEDEEQVRIVARGVLRRYGYTVLDACDPSEALAIAEEYTGDIELLLTDVVMPGMSGPELAYRIRESRTNIRVLCMSGYTDDAVVRHGLVDAGMAFMQKPIVPETLARKLREVLGG